MCLLTITRRFTLHTQHVKWISKLVIWLQFQFILLHTYIFTIHTWHKNTSQVFPWITLECMCTKSIYSFIELTFTFSLDHRLYLYSCLCGFSEENVPVFQTLPCSHHHFIFVTKTTRTTKTWSSFLSFVFFLFPQQHS